MDGVLNVYKEPGCTSHDVVNKVRRIFGIKRVGHAGTLDPMATGVLVVCIGNATRIVEYLVGKDKEYKAKMLIGASSDTEDSTGNIISHKDTSNLTNDQIINAVSSLKGEIQQIPPMMSAIKIDGKPLYKLAREGKTVERAPRKITVHSISVDNIEVCGSDDCSHFVDFTVKCSSGTYIRTLCVEIGNRLGYPALMAGLERTSVGEFGIKKSVKLEQLSDLFGKDDTNKFIDSQLHLMSIRDAINWMPEVVLDETESLRFIQGNAVKIDNIAKDTIKVLSSDGRFLGIGEITEDDETLLKPHKVFERNS